ncbi:MULTISPECIES: hypothetical protein [unclassified Pseudomonas]|uniref:hypothetical protein n=1 Tax=unclassified Pseudomonas TaxID=196821 RepID=UPI00111C42F2|nr:MULTISPECIES: hypothetical protein [unclassified Pseudomonas]
MFGFIKRVFQPASEESVLGYSISELKAIFRAELQEFPRGECCYPVFASLVGLGVQAFYSDFVMDVAEVGEFQALVGERFAACDEIDVNGLVVRCYLDEIKNSRLVVSVSKREFKVATVRLITNDIGFLESLGEKRFAVPPPWVVFENYNASWWGGDMQGAQGYYNDTYFSMFFLSLNRVERASYYARYSASEIWISSLELMLES